MANQTETSLSGDATAWVHMQTLGDFADLRRRHMESSTYWWPEICPRRAATTFSFSHRMQRFGPITVLDADFGDPVWVNGGDLRPHYQVTLPVRNSCAAMESGCAVITAARGGPAAL